ncbi:hypothetical protein [Sorangium sp. So ce388]|uniref:hypothetical protein n=1 Tax=Sorangium sp. So ce388 TaxID=3133309 RepID=UPI003F5B5316
METRPARWSPGEAEHCERVRSRLKTLPLGCAVDAVFDALSSCFPWQAGMIETIRESRPFEPEDLICGVPDAFLRRRAALIEQDPAVPVSLWLPPGKTCSDRYLFSSSERASNTYVREMYPPKGCFVGACGIVISRLSLWDDMVRVGIYLFRGEEGAAQAEDRALHMLEALHAELVEAVEKTRLALLPDEPIYRQEMDLANDGFVFARRDGSLVKPNRRAFELCASYAPPGDNRDGTTAGLQGLLRRCDATPGVPMLRADSRAQLIVRRVHVPASQRGPYDDLAFYRLEEAPLVACAVTAEGERLLARLDDVEQDIALAMVRTSAPNKRIAVDMDLGMRAFEKRVQRIAEKLEIKVPPGGRVRPVLKRLLTGR